MLMGDVFLINLPIRFERFFLATTDYTRCWSSCTNKMCLLSSSFVVTTGCRTRLGKQLPVPSLREFIIPSRSRPPVVFLLPLCGRRSASVLSGEAPIRGHTCAEISSNVSHPTSICCSR